MGWLNSFIAVCHTGSFTKAARKLGITQPAVTQQIRGLEAELGKPLFERTPEGAVPTPEGEALAHSVEGSILQIDAAVKRHFAGTTSERPLRLGGPGEIVMERVMASIMPVIASGVDVRISLGEASELLSDLKKGYLDMVVSTIRPRERGLEATPLTDEEFVLVAAPGIADQIPACSPRELPGVLKKFPMVSYAESMPIIRRYWRSVFEELPSGPPAVVVPDLRVVVVAVVAGAGFSVLPMYLCAGELAAGELVRLLDPEIPPINTFYLALRSGTISDPRLADLHRVIVDQSKTWMPQSA